MRNWIRQALRSSSNRQCYISKWLILASKLLCNPAVPHLSKCTSCSFQVSPCSWSASLRSLKKAMLPFTIFSMGYSILNIILTIKKDGNVLQNLATQTVICRPAIASPVSLSEMQQLQPHGRPTDLTRPPGIRVHLKVWEAPREHPSQVTPQWGVLSAGPTLLCRDFLQDLSHPQQAHYSMNNIPLWTIYPLFQVFSPRFGCK